MRLLFSYRDCRQSNQFCAAPSQLKDFYAPDALTSRFGQGINITAAKNTSVETTHVRPTRKEGQQSEFSVCPFCQLPRAPSYSASSQCLPPSPRLLHTPTDLCCECYHPDIKMPTDDQDSLPSQKPHIQRKSSLSHEEFGELHRKHDGSLEQCVDRESKVRNEMSVGAWL